MKTRTIERSFHLAVSLLFLGMLFIPPVKMLISTPLQFSLAEKRALSEKPEIPRKITDFKSYFQELDTYLSDHFGYRDILISRYHREVAKRFGKTGMESKVLLGKEDWYFFTAKGQLQDYSGELTLSQEELEEWVVEKNARRDWLASLGIEYLLVSPPGKHSIYPEYLPEKLTSRQGVSRFEQLIAHTANKPLPYLVNLHEPLRKAKDTGMLYFKSDTHWNLRGAYVGYLEIVDKLQSLFPEESFKTDFTFGEDVEQSCSDLPLNCDLARMALQQDRATEFFPSLNKTSSCAKPRSMDHYYHLTDFKQSKTQPSIARGCKNRDLTALVFRDSFFVDVEPFLSENFRHVVYLWKDYDQRNIEEIFAVYTPDVVIEAVVERRLF